MKRFIFEGDIGMTITEVIEKNAATHPTKPYLYFKEVEISYGMLKEIVSKIANGLLLLGVRKGDRICFLLGNCPEFLYFRSSGPGHDREGSPEPPSHRELADQRIRISSLDHPAAGGPARLHRDEFHCPPSKPRRVDNSPPALSIKGTISLSSRSCGSL